MRFLNNLAGKSERRLARLARVGVFRKCASTSFVLLAGLVVGMKAQNPDAIVQSNDKTVSVFPAKSFVASQVRITEVNVGETTRQFKESREGDLRKTSEANLQSGPDWLKRTSIQIENVSGKPIVYLSIAVRFPETKASGDLMVYSISFGRPPGRRIQNSEPLLLLPKDGMRISLGPEYGKMSAFLGSRQPIVSVNRIEIEVSFIVFEDGTAWNAGTFMHRDPNNPDRYIPSVAQDDKR